jgi:hypothetical protein
VKIHPVTPIAPERLNRMRLRTKRAYRLLSYSFSLRSNREFIANRVDDVLGEFGIAHAATQDRETFRLVDLGPKEPRRYRLYRENDQLIGSAWLVDVIFHLMLQTMQEMMNQNEDFLLLHAGAVITPGGKGVLLPAASGSGKTTLVTALVRAGFGFLSDELGVIEPGTARVHPFPRALNLKEGTLSLFPDLRPDDDGLWGVRSRAFARVDTVRPGSDAEACEIAFVIAPRHRPGAATEVTALSSAELTKELWANTMNLPRLGAKALSVLVNVSRRAKGYRLVSSDLQESVEAVMGLVGVHGRTVPVLHD